MMNGAPPSQANFKIGSHGDHGRRNIQEFHWSRAAASWLHDEVKMQ